MSLSPTRPLALGLAILGAAAVTLLPAHSEAKGWQEMHQTSDDVRVSVEPDGTALVQHHMRYRVLAGRFTTIDLPGVVEGAEPLPDVVVVSEKTGEVEAHLEAHPKEERTLRVAIDAPKGLRRGAYVVDARYRVNLAAAKLLMRDGAMWRLSWTTPAGADGHDSVRVVLDFPAAATEPRLVTPASTEPVVDTTMATLRRGPERDELELVRAHVARGEAVAWSVRVDPRALSKLTMEAEKTSGETATPRHRPPPDRTPIALAVCALVMLAALLSKLSRSKAEAVASRAAKTGSMTPPLVPVTASAWFSLTSWVRHALFGALGAATLAALSLGHVILGALAALAVIALGTYRNAPREAAPCRPGRWLPMSTADALSAKRPPWDGAWVDASTWRGRAALALLLLSSLAACVVVAARATPVGASLVLLAASLVPLWITGTRRALGARGKGVSKQLSPVVAALESAKLTVRAVGRFPAHADGAAVEPDEVRLRVTSPRARPGFGAIELAAAAPTWVDVFVRVREGSPAAARLAEIAPDHAIVCGRSPDERVMTLVPDAPRGVERFVIELMRALDAAPTAEIAAAVPVKLAA